MARTKFSLFLTLLCVALLGGCEPKRVGDLAGTNSSEPSGSGHQVQPEEEEGFKNISAEAMNRRTPVIMYHDLKEKRGRDTVWFDCTRAEFEEQVKKIEEGGWTPISLDQLYAHLTKGEEIPEKAIVLTFDDNYQGYYDIAYPILKEKGWPSVVFVHTAFVGKTEGDHPKMTWATLKELNQDPLVSIESHTVTHPNLTELDEEKQRVELDASRRDLADKLGRKIRYLAYPEGKHDEVSVRLSEELGYQMAFTIKNGPAELSPGILQVNRTIHTKLDEALAQAEQALASAPRTVRAELKTGPVEFEEIDKKRFKLVMIKGGNANSITSETRESVGEFITRTEGAVAGINGTFFNMAAIVATDNKLVGPSISPDRPEFTPDLMEFRYGKLVNRPLLMWNDKEFVVTPYVPERFKDDTYAKSIQEGTTNLFLGGAWLVSGGIPFPEKELRAFGSQDLMDPRRRAAFGILTDGRFFAAAAKNSISSEAFAEALAESGVQEAVLLDSGFSTSLVFNEKILASGHSTKDKPSRPVPHAILFSGELDPASIAIAEKTEPATAPNSGGTTRRRRR